MTKKLILNVPLMNRDNDFEKKNHGGMFGTDYRMS